MHTVLIFLGRIQDQTRVDEPSETGRRALERFMCNSCEAILNILASVNTHLYDAS